MVSRRRRLRRTLPTLLAGVFVVLVGLFVYRAVRTESADIISTAAEIRKGDPLNGIKKNPTAAINMLERVLDREPENYDATLEAALAWGALQNYDTATELLEHAAALGSAKGDLLLQIKPLKLGVNFFIGEGEFDKAVEWAQAIAALQPKSKMHVLGHGLAQYNSSLAVQEIVLERLIPKGLSNEDKGTGHAQAIETYVSDLWGSPDVEALLDILTPATNASFRAETKSLLVDARDRFLNAAQIFSVYPDAPRFDPAAADGYIDLLRRSGRIYDAHLEAAISLRQPRINQNLRRSMLESQAQCLVVLEEFGGAADLYGQIVNEAQDLGVPVPPVYIHALIENQVWAEEWDWILDNYSNFAQRLNNDIFLQYAHARALQATGQLEAATEQIGQAFSMVSLGTRMPASILGFPHRRRSILLLSYELYDAAGNTTALTALDSLINHFPNDVEGLEARIRVQLSRDRFEPAMDDAFELLTENRRNPENFQQWLDIANELSLQRYSLTLEERALDLIEFDLKDSSDSDSSEPEATSGTLPKLATKSGVNPKATYLPTNPALAWTVIRERIPYGQLERARNDLRHLTEMYPHVQEFRFQLGKLLLREGLLESAIAEFQQVLQLVPSDTEALDLTTRLEFALNNSKAAADLLNKMILADPLGVGAERYAQQLLASGRAADANQLFKRLFRWEGFEPGRNLFIMSARAFLALGDIERATALLIMLSKQYPYNEDVALLGLEIGLQTKNSDLIASAIVHIQPLVSGLLPDQVSHLSTTLLESGYNQELLDTFPENIRDLPVLESALRPLAEAAKALGDVDLTDQLLKQLNDEESLRDRFLLLSFDNRIREASRRLRLSSATKKQPDLELCLLAAASMTGFQTMYDMTPVSTLRAMGLDHELSPASLELLDAVLRIAPNAGDLSEVIPPEVITAPHATYPNAGADVTALLEELKKDPERTAGTMRSITLLMLASDRPVWSREGRLLGQQIHEHIPGLQVISRHLAQQALRAGRHAEALEFVKQLLDPANPDPQVLQMFMEAAQAIGHDEWGLALALDAKLNDDARLVLAEALLEREFLKEGLPHFLTYLKNHPEDVRAISGVIQTMAALDKTAGTVEWIRKALTAHPHDESLAHDCIDSLSLLSNLNEEAFQQLQTLGAENPGNVNAYGPLARHYAKNGLTDHLIFLIDVFSEQLQETQAEFWSEQAMSEAAAARALARIAHEFDLNDKARLLNNLALQWEPGSVELFRDLAAIELVEGNLEAARRYLEAVSIIQPNDRESPLALARLLFEQAGQPHVAADVIRQSYGQQLMPLAAVEVLAAELYLRGKPEEALQIFHEVRHHPQVTTNTLLTVARIAYAAGLDEEAIAIFNQFLQAADTRHPARDRVKSLLAISSLEENEKAPEDDSEKDSELKRPRPEREAAASSRLPAAKPSVARDSNT
jgi:tetratricopeptide (TPR) repeat protein